MLKHKKYRVVILGTGNVAWHLAHGWFEKGVDIVQVYGRNSVAAQKLAIKVNSLPIDDISQLVKDADLYLLAVSDKAIQEVLGQIVTTGVVVHTAGTLGLEVFPSSLMQVGVMYPLQTFTKGRALSLRKIPFLIEYSTPEAGQVIRQLAKLLSTQVRELSVEDRRTLHVAAVFASNFTNYLYGVAAQLVEEKHISVKWLKPLVKETQKKAFDMSAIKAQTGPAKRQDTLVMAMHQDLLFNPSHKALYQLISDQIIQSTNTNLHGKL